jgi:hypothetical protein
VTTAAGPTLPPKHFFGGLGLEQAGFTIGYVDPVGVAQTPSGWNGELFPQGLSYDVLVVDTRQTYVGPGRIPRRHRRGDRRSVREGLH